MRPVVAMLLCIAFAGLVGAGLWQLGKDDPAPPPPPVVPTTGPTPEQQHAAESAARQAELVLDEDDRIASTVFARKPTRTPRGPATTVLPAAARSYTLDSLIRLGAARRAGTTADGAPVVEIVRSVLVLPGAKLVIDTPGATVRLASGPDGFVSLVSWAGAIAVTGAENAPLTLTSWDGAGPDGVVADGRAYVRIIGGDLSTAFVKASHLGFWSGRTGGVAVTGLGDRPATATLKATDVRDSHYGLYTSDTSSVTVADSTFTANQAGGVLLHRGSANVVLERTTVNQNGGPGILAGRGSHTIALRQVTADANAGDGIRFDGGPLASDPGPAGASIAGHRDFRIEGSTVRGNRDDGVQIVDADDVVVTGNVVTGHGNGIVLTGAIVGARVEDNQVSGAVTAGIAVRDGPSGVLVGRNRVAGGLLGIQVRAARAEVRGNAVEGVTGHAVSLVGAVTGSTVVGNTLAGRGRSGLDTARMNPGAVVALDANDVTGWDIEIPLGERVADTVRDHPLLPLWVVVLLLPVLLLVVRLRRRRRAQPYAEVVAPPDPAVETQLVPLAARRAAARVPGPPPGIRRPGPVPPRLPQR
ncbi:MAG: right-handed parallel beta-helix repeat-containing protein, partial [Pseudonocardia sp.]|nr:right-handed parallel beta-helix repeat-containing protein [Pseudonocardia sp.]